VRGLLDAGVRTVVDLRTAAEPPGIRSLFEKLASDDAAAWTSFPILNGAAPTSALLELILDTIDAQLARERGVYVHCAGGRGRTGTVIACWWIRHGLFESEQALEELKRRRQGLPNGHTPSPETDAQFRLVRSWRRGQ
jgi:protein-tyrosine phosphatase